MKYLNLKIQNQLIIFSLIFLTSRIDNIIFFNKLNLVIDPNYKLAINDFFLEYIQSQHVSPLGKLLFDKIELGESKTIEFKESLSLDVRQSENNKSYVPKKEEKIELSVLKTIAGFLNSDGGELFIGVNDESIICGIENELKRFHKSSKDKMQLHLKSLIMSSITYLL